MKTYLEQALPQQRMDFLVCDSVEGEYTYEDLESLSQEVVGEVVTHIAIMARPPQRISFVGHSMGAVIVRACISHDLFAPYVGKLYTFLSLSGPHLGLIGNPSRLVYTGLVLLQKWKRSRSLAQLAMKDETDLRRTFLYRLAATSKLHRFKNVLLAASGQDYYAPYYSARIEMNESGSGGGGATNALNAASDVLGGIGASIARASGGGSGSSPSSTPAAVANEMVRLIMEPLIKAGNETTPAKSVNVIRYDVRLAQQGNVADSITGRLNHIAFIDSEVFLEKFLSVHAWEYFA